MGRWGRRASFRAVVFTAAIAVGSTGSVAAVVRGGGHSPFLPATAAGSDMGEGAPSDRYRVATAPATAPFTATAPSTVTTPSPAPPTEVAPAAEPPAGVVWAVVIGIDQYPEAQDLAQAVADAEEMRAALTGFGVDPDHQLVLHDGQATADAILAALDWLTAHAGPADTAVVFYSGHVRKLDSDTEAVLAADERPVPDTQLADHLRGLVAQDAWLVMAACFGGGFDELLAPGRILTAAADADSLAYESAGYSLSYLVEFAVHQPFIEGHTAPIVQDAVAHGRAELERLYPDRQLVSFDLSSGPILLDRTWSGGSLPSSIAPPGPGAPPTPPEAPAPQPEPPAQPQPPAPPPAPPPECQGLFGIFCG